MVLKTLSNSEIFSRLKKKNQFVETSEESFVMYSSLWEGFTNDPLMMTVPISDHMVHRGDGVFETLRVVKGAIYDLDAHLSRLKKSSEAIGMKWSKSLEEIKTICFEMLKMEKSKKDALIRLFISRGPGGFAADPRDSIGTQLYIVLTNFKSLPEEMYRNGVSVMVSKIPVKQDPYNKIKSCNYLHNVLMKKEAFENKVNYSLSFTSDGYLAEGATENVALLNDENGLFVPSFDYTLRGTTLLRVMELSQTLIKNKELSSVRMAHIPFSSLSKAKEIFLIGTTIEILSVSKIIDKRLLKFKKKQDSVAERLRALLKKDMEENQELRSSPF